MCPFYWNKKVKPKLIIQVFLEPNLQIEYSKAEPS